MVTTLAEPLQDIEVLIEKVSKITGMKAGQISEQISEANVSAFQYEDSILVSLADFDPIIDAWAESLKQKLKGVKTVTNLQAPVELDEAVDSTEPIVSPTDEGELSWPNGYENVVTHLYTPTLKKVLPTDPEQRKRFLKAIATETATGQRLAEELAKAIVARVKRNLAYDTVLAGVKAKCAEML